jgi:hypothetical protein
MSEQQQPHPWWSKPKPVILHSGRGYDTESRIVTPSTELDQTRPRATPGLQHRGVPPSPRR